MRDWILSHDMEHTTTAADESAGNGRVESKLLLTTARAPPTYWPMALRHASEYRLRKTLEQLGVPVPRLIPFGTEAIAKSKFWHRTMKGFPTPMQKVKVWGPAVGMSLSSKGYWIEADGKWMRSTAVVQPGARPDLRPELPLEAQAELLDNASIAMSDDQQDVVAPNQVDAAGQPVVNLEHIDQDDQVPHEEAIDSRLRGCHFEDANAVQQSGGVLSGGRLGQCMGYFGTSSSKEAGNRGKTADHRRSTVHGSHSTT